MNIFRIAAFRALAAMLALPLLALVIAGCDVEGADSTTAVVSDNEGNIYNYSGLYMSPSNSNGSTNGYVGLVFPADKQTGATLIWLRLLQYGSVLEAYDNVGLTWAGNVSAQNGEIASFSLTGQTTAGQPVEITGTLTYESQTSTMDGTWIEPTFAGSIFAAATVAPVTTNAPVSSDLAIDPDGTITLSTNGAYQAFSASGGNGSYTWSFNGTGGSLSVGSGASTTFTRSSTGTGVISLMSDGDTVTAVIMCP